MVPSQSKQEEGGGAVGLLQGRKPCIRLSRGFKELDRPRMLNPEVAGIEHTIFDGLLLETAIDIIEGLPLQLCQEDEKQENRCIAVEECGVFPWFGKDFVLIPVVGIQ